MKRRRDGKGEGASIFWTWNKLVNCVDVWRGSNLRKRTHLARTAHRLSLGARISKRHIDDDKKCLRSSGKCVHLRSRDVQGFGQRQHPDGQGHDPQYRDVQDAGVLLGKLNGNLQLDPHPLSLLLTRQRAHRPVRNRPLPSLYRDPDAAF